MNHLQSIKVVPAVYPGAIVNNTSFSGVAIDTLDFDAALVVVQLGATDIKMAALKLQESDASGSGYVDVTGLDFSSPDHLPVATDDNGLFAFNVDLRGRKRYLMLVATAGNGVAGTYLSAFALLGRGHDLKLTDTGRGFVYSLNSVV